MKKGSLPQDIRAILFDIDGTLIDSMPIWDELGARYLRARGIEPEADLGKILFPMTIDEGVTYLKEHYPLGEAKDEIRAGLMKTVDDFYRYEVPAKDGTAEFLKQAASSEIPMVLTTIGEPAQEEAALTRLGLRGFFRKMYVCEEYHTTKKEPRIYQIAACDLGVKPENTLVVEDMLQAVRAAGGAGFRTLAVADAASRKDREELIRTADCFIDSFLELL
jgi:HAD superfamily hydrolase (TIGR01509 family)